MPNKKIIKKKLTKIKQRTAKYEVKLTKEEIFKLRQIIKKGKHRSQEIHRAQILLLSNDKQTDSVIQERTDVSRDTIINVRKKFVEGGIDRAIYDAKRSGQPPKITMKIEATLIAIACSEPKEHRTHWTLELLQQELIKKTKLKSISTVAILKHLQKRGIKPWLKKNVVYT